MTSKTSFPERWYEFCQTYRWSLKKNIGILVLLAVLMFAALPMMLIITLPQRVATYGMYEKAAHALSRSDYINQNVQNILQTLVPSAVITLVLLFGVILCITLFSYMQKKRSTDLFHALPVGRTPMLLGRWCAGLTVLFVPVVFNFLIVAVICASYGVTLKESLAVAALRVILMGTLAFTSAMFMAVCSGTMFDTILSIVGVNAGYPLLIFLGGNVAEMILPGLHLEQNSGFTVFVTTALAPYASAYAVYVSSLSSAWFYVWWIALTIVFLWGSVGLYRKRRSESAEDNFAFPIPKLIIRFLLTASGGLALGIMLNSNGPAGFLIGIVAGSVLVHVIVEILYSRGFQHVWKSFAWYGAFAAVFLIFYGVVSTGFFGYDTRVPNASDVQSVSLKRSGYTNDESMPNNTDIYDENYNRIMQLSPVIRAPKNIQEVIKAHNQVIRYYRENGYPYTIKNSVGYTVAFSYQLKNGSVLTRSYQYYDGYKDPHLQMLEQQTKNLSKMPEYLENTDLIFYLEPAYISSARIAPFSEKQLPISLKESDIPRLLDAMCQDYLNGKLNTGGAHGYFTVDLTPQENITPEGRLKSLLGNYTGKINFDHLEPYQVSDKSSATYQLAQKLGLK